MIGKDYKHHCTLEYYQAVGGGLGSRAVARETMHLTGTSEEIGKFLSEWVARILDGGATQSLTIIPVAPSAVVNLEGTQS